MGKCATQVFENISPGHFACLVDRAKAAGIQIDGNSGTTLPHNGVSVAWEYDPEAQTLSIQCLSLPFLVSCGAANAQIHNLVDNCTPQ
jgi:hypothetical protein